jgi:hypothetical protein
MSRSSKLQAALAGCVFLFIALGLALARPGFVDYAPYLSFSPDTDGTKAIRLLMEREGANVKEWRLEPERLPAGAGLRHRLILAPQAELEGVTSDVVVQETLAAVPVPR